MQHLSFPSFLSIVETFKRRALNKQLSSADIVLYNLVRGLPANRGFSPIINPIKLANGDAPNQSFKRAMWYIGSQLKYYPHNIHGYVFTEDERMLLAQRHAASEGL